jgi:uracil-DNA glycosylase family 4
VGEAPGCTEAVEGRPFVGKAGRRLDKGLSDKGVNRSNVYITNTVLCHPRGNQSPPPREAIQACHERLITEIRGVLGPEGQRSTAGKVLALGKTAGKELTGDSRPVEQLRLLLPAPNPYLGGRAEVRVTYHPSRLPMNPTWSDRFDVDLGWLADR